MTALRLGTRRSLLARTQSEHVAAALRAATGYDVELVEVVTAGDTSTASLRAIGGAGVFVSALREALASGHVDLAVHSLKDLPTAPAEGLVLAATPRREDPRDVLVARDGLALAELPARARVGTGSPRRAAQLRALGLGLEVVDIRGNVDTRLRMVTDGVLDAVVLAHAGLLRVGRASEASEVLDPMLVLPAAGQGALAVECRADDAVALAAANRLDDPPTRVAVTAERSVLAALEAGCTAPVGALAEVSPGDAGGHGHAAGRLGEVFLRAVVVAADGSAALRRSATGSPDAAAELGRALAVELLRDGAADLVAAPPAPVPDPPATQPYQRRTHQDETNDKTHQNETPHREPAATAAWRVEK